MCKLSICIDRLSNAGATGAGSHNGGQEVLRACGRRLCHMCAPRPNHLLGHIGAHVIACVIHGPCVGALFDPDDGYG